MYSAAKIRLHAYTKSLRLQLKSSSVKVFELAPPKTSRPMFKRGESGANKAPEMPVPKVVEAMIAGIRKDKPEILQGMSKLLKLEGRLTL